MANWIDVKGPVVADTVYADNVLVAKDVAFTLPALSFLTADVQAMGTMSVAIPGLLEHMELTVTKVGLDAGLSRLSRLQSQNLEFRWVQNSTKSDAAQTADGCKAFVRTLPGNFPGIGIEVGGASEIEMTYGVTRLQIYVGGTELLCVDRLSQILRVSGKDYMRDINNLL